MANFNLSNAALRVCVDSVEGGRFSGQVYSRQFSQPLFFSDAGNLVLKVEEVLDAQNFPQAFQRTRIFVPKENTSTVAVDDPADGLSAETVAAAKGKVTTFVMHVLSRQSSTWQGIIDFLDGRPPQTFSSDLEFLRLVDEGVSRIN
jgi:hypothetical protein